MPFRSFDALIFDLDGTLIDSVPDIAAAIGRRLRAAGLEPLPIERTASFVGQGTRRLVERAFAHRGRPLDARELDRRQAEFEADYARHCAVKTRPYPEVAETLAELARLHCRMAVCTNKPEAISRDVLAALDLSRYFGAVVGGDTCAARKPDPEPLFACARALDVEPGRCIYVGDSLTDAETARRASMRLILVSYGYESAALDAQGAVAVLERFGRLVEVLVHLPPPSST
ncbi:MAG: phosphoglycolate phosphatase [Geminicoccaceae bacterium]|nr:phosphoglycolate phosphatase [Geminicoccaceae bacterium]